MSGKRTNFYKILNFGVIQANIEQDTILLRDYELLDTLLDIHTFLSTLGLMFTL